LNSAALNPGPTRREDMKSEFTDGSANIDATGLPAPVVGAEFRTKWPRSINRITRVEAYDPPIWKDGVRSTHRIEFTMDAQPAAK
jgi:hypothetical protein